MVIGAHPDDAEFKAGGLAAIYRRLGHEVLFVSVTDGSAGHHISRGAELAARRREEAARAGEVLGLTYEVWNHPDGRLTADLSARHDMIRAIRRFQPDLLLTHRPNDYHPDHRATSQLVQDAAYLLTVPPICPEVPHLRRDPVIAYLSDDFTRPYPFTPTVIVDITRGFEAKVAMLDAHASQFHEWLPYNGGYEPRSARRRPKPNDRGSLGEWPSCRGSPTVIAPRSSPRSENARVVASISWKRLKAANMGRHSTRPRSRGFFPSFELDRQPRLFAVGYWHIPPTASVVGQQGRP